VTKIAIIPVDSSDDLIVFQKTVLQEVNLNSLEPILFVKLHELLQYKHGNDRALFWGISSGPRSSEANKWNKISPDDVVFFVKENRFLGFAVVKTKFQSENVAWGLWPELQSDESRQYLLTLEKYFEVDDRESRLLESIFRKGRLHLETFQIIDNLISSEILGVIESQDYVPSTVSSGQGFELTSHEKKVVEMYAVKLAIEHLSELGYTHIQDVGDRESFDLLAVSAEKQLCVEVKGSTGAASSVILTKNEVSFQLDAFPLNGLFVVSDIQLVRGETLTARGGDIQFISPWLIDENRLKAISYEYRVDDSNEK
jgi:hypothetical protein